MRDNILYINSDNFQQEVLESSIPVIVDFYSEDCSPCEVLAPIYEKMAEKYGSHIYAARAKMDTVVIDESVPGGQTASTYHVANYPGTPGVVRGKEIIRNMREQATSFGAKIHDLKEIFEVNLRDKIKYVRTEDTEYYAKAFIIASGARPRALPAEQADEFKGRGIHYCATCDGSMYQDRKVVVVGGGNSAVEEAVFLTKFASHVTIIHQFDHFQASKTAEEEAFRNDKIDIIWDSEVRKVTGQGHALTSVQIENLKSKELTEVPTEEAFVYIGTEPDDDKGFAIVLNEHPEVKTLYERRHLYPDRLEINGVNPVFHVMMEGIVENQLHALSEVREIYEKLQKEKVLAPHAARGCIARVFIHGFFAVIKEQQPFDTEAYVRRLGLIGKDVSKLGRNDRCPCGSGAKFKRCCTSYREAFEIYPLAGRLDLGYGSYILAEQQNIQDPLDPIYQLEARFHIAEYMETHIDLEGALAALKENIALSESYRGCEFQENAWQDLLFFCQNHVQFAEEGLKASEHLLGLVKSDKEKGSIICDKADLLANMGNIESAENEYIKIFDVQPDFHIGHFRYALMLRQHEREEKAKQILRELLTNNGIDEETRDEAMNLLDELGEDTAEFEYLF